MHPNEALLRRFYAGFEAKDVAAIDASYTPDATFKDPVFPALKGPEVTAMWRMLAARAKDFSMTLEHVRADDRAGEARWEARYAFAKTGRRVTNRISSKFEFRDGRIAKQVDHFDFWRWSRMALGPAGVALGWTPIVQGKVRAEAAGNLATFMAREGARTLGARPSA